MKNHVLNFSTGICLMAILIFSCQKKKQNTEELDSKFAAATSTTSGSTTGSSTTGSSTTGGSTTGSSTTGGSTTGSSANQKGSIVFHKSEGYSNTIYLYFKGDYQGTLGPSARHANPTCNQNGCIIKTNLSYGSYSWRADVKSADGSTVVYTKSGSVNLNASCVAVNATP